MVVALGPGKFYGSSLPRPRFYTDLKFNHQRVDPPAPVLDPLLEWANEAHWSMGGLSLKRVRLQGRIEGNVVKLRKEQEDKYSLKNNTPKSTTPTFKSSKLKRKKGKKAGFRADSPPPAPVARKLKLRSRVVDVEGEKNSEEEEAEVVLASMVKAKKRRLVRKLGDDFELVAGDLGKTKSSPLPDNGGRVSETGGRTTRRRSMVLNVEEEEEETEGMSKKSGRKDSVLPNQNRSSPRLKQKSS